MNYSSPNLELVEEFEGDNVLYAPDFPWMTVIACALITIGQNLIG